MEGESNTSQVFLAAGATHDFFSCSCEPIGRVLLSTRTLRQKCYPASDPRLLISNTWNVILFMRAMCC